MYDFDLRTIAPIGIFALLLALVLAMPMTSPAASTYTVVGRLSGASCSTKSSSGLSIQIGGLSGGGLDIEMTNDAGVRQYFRITSPRHCLNVGQHVALSRLRSEFPRGARIEVKLRSFSDPNVCDHTSKGKGLLDAASRSRTCSFDGGISSVQVAGRRVF